MPPKRKGRNIPPDTPPERHGVITLTVKVQGTNLTVDMNVMGELNIGERASALEFLARTAREQTGRAAAMAELQPKVEALQRQAEEMEKVQTADVPVPHTEDSVPVVTPLKRRRRRTAAAKAAKV